MKLKKSHRQLHAARQGLYDGRVESRIVIAAGGTGGHIFPALSAWRSSSAEVASASLLWIGTSRSRERELCGRNAIPLEILDVEGIRRAMSLSVVRAVVRFVKAVFGMMSLFGKNRPNAVVAFGGYVCAPVLSAARLRRVPYYLQEQNTIPGLVNRVFARGGAGYSSGSRSRENTGVRWQGEVTGTPVRAGRKAYEGYPYPPASTGRKRRSSSAAEARARRA